MSTVITDGNTTTTIWDWCDGEICWDNNPYCWDEVRLVEELIEGGGGLPGEGVITDWNEGYNKLDEPKKKRFITLVGKVKGEKDIFKDKKEIGDIQISVSDIKLTVESVLGIKIDIEKE